MNRKRILSICVLLFIVGAAVMAYNPTKKARASNNLLYNVKAYSCGNIIGDWITREVPAFYTRDAYTRTNFKDIKTGQVVWTNHPIIVTTIKKSE